MLCEGEDITKSRSKEKPQWSGLNRALGCPN